MALAACASYESPTHVGGSIPLRGRFSAGPLWHWTPRGAGGFQGSGPSVLGHGSRTQCPTDCGHRDAAQKLPVAEVHEAANERVLVVGLLGCARHTRLRRDAQAPHPCSSLPPRRHAERLMPHLCKNYRAYLDHLGQRASVVSRPPYRAASPPGVRRQSAGRRAPRHDGKRGAGAEGFATVLTRDPGCAGLCGSCFPLDGRRRGSTSYFGRGIPMDQAVFQRMIRAGKLTTAEVL